MKVLLPLVLAALALAPRAHAAPADEVAELSDDMRITVTEHAPQIRRCYERALRDAPDLGGRLVVRFRVGADGRPRKLEAVARESTLRDRGVVDCVARVFGAMKFRRVRTATWYRSPLIFGRG